MKILIGIGVVILLVIAIAALPFLIDLNRYQDQYRPVIEEALNRKVTLEDIRLTVWPRIGARVAGFTVQDDPAFRPGSFASLSSLDVAVKLFPLLSGKVIVEEISLRDPVITVLKNKDGVLNISTMGATAVPASEPEQPEAPPTPGGPLQALALLAVDQVAITGGALTYRDESGPTPIEYQIDDLEFLLQSVHLGDTPSLHLAANVLPYNLPIKLDGTFGPLTETLDLEQFAFDVALGKTALALKGRTVGGKAQATMTSPMINTADLPVTLPLTKPIHVKDLSVTVDAQYPLPESVPIEKAADIQDLTLAVVMGESVLKVKGSLLSGDVKLAVDSSSINSTDLPLALPLTKPVLVNDLHVSAHAKFPPKPGVPPQELADIPDLRFAVAMGNSVLNIKGAGLAGNFKLMASSRKINTADLPVEFPVKKPVEIKDLQILGELKGQDARINSAIFEVFNGQITAQAATALGRTTPPFNGKVSIAGLQLGPAWDAVGTDHVSINGKAAADLAVQGRGYSVPDLTKSLEGTGRFAVKDGKLEGINLLQEALILLKAVGVSPESVKATAFSTIESDFTIKQGKVNVLRTLVDSHDFQATGKGTVGFDQTLDLALDLSLSQELSKQIVGASPVTKVAMKRGRLSVPLLIGGTTQAPTYSLDAKAFGGKLQQQVKETVEEAVGELLRGSAKPEDIKRQGEELLKGLFGR